MDEKVKPEFKVGDKVWYAGSWGNEPERPGIVIDITTYKGRLTYGVRIEGQQDDYHWGYDYQFRARDVE